MNYSSDVNLDRIVKKVVKECHPGLKKATIESVFKSGEVGRNPTESKQGKKAKFYTVKKIDEAIRSQWGVDFMVVVDKFLFDGLEPAAQEAVLDEALSKMGLDSEGKTFTRDPDVILYANVIERRGFYTEQLEKAGERLRQLPLFKEPPEDKGKNSSASVH